MEIESPMDLKALTRVWHRVSAPEPDEAPEDTLRAELARFIRNARAAGAMYELLAMKTRGSDAEGTFRRMAAQERDNERRLQAEHLLLTGDTCAAPRLQASAPGVTGAVREACLSELENAGRLEAAAARRREKDTAALFRELAERERSHAAALRRLLELML